MLGLIDSIDAILSAIEDVLDGEVFGQSLPLVGDSLADAATFIHDFRVNIVDELRQEFIEHNNSTAAVAQEALFEALGPSGLDLLADTNSSGTITIDDVEVIETDVDNDQKADQIDFEMLLDKSLSLLQIPVDFDIGLPGLGLDVDGNVEVLFGFTWELSFGLSRDYGFYFNTGVEDELNVFLDARIPDLAARGQLGFLQLDVKDEDADGNPNNANIDVDNDGKKGTSFGAQFSIDLKDPINDPEDDEEQHNDNDKFTFDEILNGGFDFSEAVDAEIVGDAQVNLDLLVSFLGDARFPTIGAELEIDWPFLGNSQDGEPQEAEDDEADDPTPAKILSSRSTTSSWD